MVVGQIVGLTAGLLPLVNTAPLVRQAPLRGRYARMLALLRRYRNFPLMAAPSSLINAAASNVPTALLATFYDVRAAGLYGLGVRVLQMPLRFVGQAIAQVLLGQASEAARSNGASTQVTATARALWIFSLHTFVTLALIAPAMFALCFGATWREAGSYVQVLAPWLLAGFIATPLSVLVTVLEKQRQELLLQIAYLALLSVALTVGGLFGVVRVTLALLSGCAAAFLLCKTWWLLGLAGCDRRQLVGDGGKEIALAAATNVPLLLVVMAGGTDIAICAAGLATLAVAHLVNLRVRRAYAF